MVGNFGIIGDRVGAIRGSGEYWMGRLRVGWIVHSELHNVAHACVD
jgi:hypothetical protein